MSRRLGALSSRRGARDAKHAGHISSRRTAGENRARDDDRAEERAERSGATKERPGRQTFRTGTRAEKGRPSGKGGEDGEEVPGTDCPSDLSLLRRLSEKEVLRVLKARLMTDTIYTTVNAMLIVVNPCHAIDGMYGPQQAATPRGTVYLGVYRPHQVATCRPCVPTHHSAYCGGQRRAPLDAATPRPHASQPLYTRPHPPPSHHLAGGGLYGGQLYLLTIFTILTRWRPTWRAASTRPTSTARPHVCTMGWSRRVHTARHTGTCTARHGTARHSHAHGVCMVHAHAHAHAHAHMHMHMHTAHCPHRTIASSRAAASPS